MGNMRIIKAVKKLLSLFSMFISQWNAATSQISPKTGGLGAINNLKVPCFRNI